MEKEKNRLFGLLGRNINYSFSRGYFAEKFKTENISDSTYVNFDIADIQQFPKILQSKGLKGLNVTIPYKQDVIPYLDELSENAQEIGAVNTITVSPEGKTTGYNTDYFGFLKSLEPLLQTHHRHALILGTGGASKGVAYALKELGIRHTFVSRTPSENQITYTDLTKDVFEKNQIIVNSTPIGTSPNVDQFPDIPYQFIDKNHIAYDLIYNPETTTFLKKCQNQGAVIKNGSDMLILQAEKSWEIWNK